jgi:hypothetical protein
VPTTTIDQSSLDHAYFEWLISQVRVHHGSQTYRELWWALYKKEFVATLPRDENRIRDGQDLLVEFFYEHGLDAKATNVGEGCSFLELIIGLSRRAAFIGGGDPVGWAWTMIGHLGLHPMSDPLTRVNHKSIDEKVDKVIRRTYRRDGLGGLFPLAYEDRDQRTIELWYQLNMYIEENVTELDPL